MSAAYDRKFIDAFNLVVGILVGLAAGTVILAVFLQAVSLPNGT